MHQEVLWDLADRRVLPILSRLLVQMILCFQGHRVVLANQSVLGVPLFPCLLESRAVREVQADLMDQLSQCYLLVQVDHCFLEVLMGQ